MTDRNLTNERRERVVNVRGPIVAVGETREVDTQYGSRELAELTVRPDRGAGEPTDVTVWGDWTETAALAEPGMELLVTDAEREEYRGETSYATTGDSYVVLEPGFLVNVTDVRSWVQCPRMYYLNKLSGVPLNYPVVKGTVVHEVFGDLLRGVDLDESVQRRVAEAGLELGLLGREQTAVEDEVRRNASAAAAWLEQGVLTDTDEWRSEQTLVSPTFGIKGRADAVRRGMPVELKTGKNTNRDPRFQDKVQAACYALLLRERGVDADTGTLLYTKNAALADESGDDTADGDLSPAKEFSVGHGLLAFVVRTRNEIAAAEFDGTVPTGYEADAVCNYCFEQDTCMVVSGRLDQPSKAGSVGRAVPTAERDYFDRMYRGLEAERETVHTAYRRLWENNASQRAANDRALIDLEPLDRRRREGGRWAIAASKPAAAVSKLREGDLVLASDGDPVGGDAELARIERLGGSPPAWVDGSLSEGRETVVVGSDEPVDVRRLDTYPSELSVDRQLTALHDAVLKGDEDRKDVLFGRESPSFRDHHETYVDNNAAQNEAVNRAVNAESFALVHGPPGTGKTYTVARTLRAFLDRGDRVLLSAFTNRAVDNALDALREQGVAEAAGVDEFADAVVRVGTEEGIREDMQDVRLVEEGTPAERGRALAEAPVVAATTASCGSRVVREQSFDVALVDEASQLTEPATLAAVNRADRFVLVGDHQQLPPVVQAEGGVPIREAELGATAPDWQGGGDGRTGDGNDGTGDGNNGTGDGDNRPPRADLSESLFERLIEQHPEAGVTLTSQYRMSQRIQAFASAEFYDGRLRPANGSVATRSLADVGVDTAALPPAVRGDGVGFVDPGGRREGNTNPVEAERIATLVEQFVAAGVPRSEIGVIAPFRAQVAEITRRTDATVDTVDRFQGSSEAVILVSFVAVGELSSPLFEDYRRVNVALTRAKRGLVLVGDEAALRSDPVYDRMVDWADR